MNIYIKIIVFEMQCGSWTCEPNGIKKAFPHLPCIHR